MKRHIKILLASASKTDYRLERFADKHPHRLSISERIDAATDLIGGNDYRAADKPLMFTPFANMLPQAAKPV